MRFGDTFTPFDIALDSGVTIHGVHSSPDPSTPTTKPAVLLLHGFPENHLMWHKVAPELATSYRVIAIDLRGYGQSSKPKTQAGESHNHELYAKSAMARDAAQVMGKLGESSFYVLSHDRGSRVAHKLCVDFPQAVKKVILLDICPTLAMYEATNLQFAKTYWHWFFLIQPAPFPETLLGQSHQFFIQAAFSPGALGSRASAFDPEIVKSYGQMFEDKDGIHSMCEDYRAGASIDMDEQREDIKDGKRIQCEVRVLWGKAGLVGKMFEPVKEWQSVSDGRVSGEEVDCGHYIPEEAPEVVLRHAQEFFK